MGPWRTISFTHSAILFAGSLQSLFQFRFRTFSFCYLLSFKMNTSSRRNKKPDIFLNIPQIADLQHFLEKDITALTKRFGIFFLDIIRLTIYDYCCGTSLCSWKMKKGQPKYRHSDKLNSSSFHFSIETMIQVHSKSSAWFQIS